MSLDARKVTFAPNVPQELALKDRQGRVIIGRRGERTVYQLVDGRSLSVSMDVALQIEQLGITASEPFGICKRWNGKRRHPAHWDIWLTPAAEQARAAVEMAAMVPPESDLESQLRESIARVRNHSVLMIPKLGLGPASDPVVAPQQDIAPQPTSDVDPVDFGPRSENSSDGVRHEAVPPAPRPSWAQVLRSQTETLTDVYAESIKYASTQHGSAVRPEDVRALMTTAFINLAQRGRSRVA